MAAASSPSTSGITQSQSKNKQNEKSRPPTVEELLIQIESHSYSSIEHRASLLIATWTCLGGQVGQFRSIEKVFHIMYRESALMIFSRQWAKVDMLFKRGLSRSLIQYSQSMGSYVKGSESLCSALVMAAYDPWGDPTIRQLLSEQDTDLNKVNEFVKSEPYELLLIRIECLVNANCEEAAIQLCRSCLQSNDQLSKETDVEIDAGSWKLSFMEWLLRLLFRKRRLNDLIAEISSCSCHDGVRIIYHTLNSKSEDSDSLTESLINLFLVRDLLFQSNYCCTSELMNLWCELQTKKQKSLQEIEEAARKLLVGHASTSAQFYLFVDILWAKFGTSLLPLYLELYIRGLTSDLNFLEAVRQTDQKEYVIELENHMAAMYFKLSTLFSSINKEVSLECLLSAFSLNPTREIMEWIKKMALQLSKEKVIKLPCSADLCKHNRSTCTHNHNCSFPAPVKRKAVVMCDQAIQVGDDSFINCVTPVKTTTTSQNDPSLPEDSKNVRKKFASEILALGSESPKDLTIKKFENQNCSKASVLVVENSLHVLENSTPVKSADETKLNKEKILPTSALEVNGENVENMKTISNSVSLSNFHNDCAFTSLSDTSHNSVKSLTKCDSDNIHNNLTKNLGANSINPPTTSEDNTFSSNKPLMNGLDSKAEITECSKTILNAKLQIAEEVKNASLDLTADVPLSVSKEKNTTSNAVVNLQCSDEKSNSLSNCNTSDNIENLCINGCSESDAFLVVEDHSKKVDKCDDKKTNSIAEACIKGFDKNQCTKDDEECKVVGDHDKSEILNPLPASEKSITPDRIDKITDITSPNEIKITKQSELLKAVFYPADFPHVILDSKIPGVPSDLLSDFVTVLESLRNKQLKSSNKWSQIKHLCEDYMEMVSEERCTVLNSHFNDSFDSEADSTSELTANGFKESEYHQSNDSIKEDHVADKSHVFKRFMNSDKVAEMATFVNLSDIHCPQIPLEKLFYTEYSSSHPGHKKRHKKHRNHDKNPKKLVLRKLRHGNKIEHDVIKRKKRKKRKGKHGKGHVKKRHSTHGKVNKLHSKNKRKKHKLKKKKEGNSGFISGDYCSDFSSEELMRIVKEHSNSYSKVNATTSKHPHAVESASSSDSEEPSRKKRKVTFDKKRAKNEKYHDKHKHDKSNKHKKKITLESCKASVTNVIHENPMNSDLDGVKDFPHFLQISRVKKMESVQIQQRSVSMVDGSINNPSLISPCVSNPQINQFVQQNFESCSPEDMMKMQLLMARQQAEVTAGSSTMSTNQALRKYVCSKMTSQLLSVAQSSNCIVNSDSETSKSPTPNFMDKNSAPKVENSFKSRSRPQKISANIKHFVIETNKSPYAFPNSNLSATGNSNNIIPMNISNNSYSEAQSLIGSMLNSNIRCPTSQINPQVTALSIPIAHSPSGSKMVTSKIIIPLPASSQMQSESVSPSLNVIQPDGSSFPSTSGTTSHSSFIIVKNGNNTQIIQAPQSPCSLIPYASKANTSLTSFKPKLNPTLSKSVPKVAKQVVRKITQPVVKRQLIKNPAPIKTVMTAPKISLLEKSTPKILAVPTLSNNPILTKSEPDALVNKKLVSDIVTTEPSVSSILATKLSTADIFPTKISMNDNIEPKVSIADNLASKDSITLNPTVKASVSDSNKALISETLSTQSSVSDILSTQSPVSDILSTKKSLNDALISKTLVSDTLSTKSISDDLHSKEVSNAFSPKASHSDALNTKTSVLDTNALKTPVSNITQTKNTAADVVMTKASVSGAVTNKELVTGVIPVKTLEPDAAGQNPSKMSLPLSLSSDIAFTEGKSTSESLPSEKSEDNENNVTEISEPSPSAKLPNFDAKIDSESDSSSSKEKSQNNELGEILSSEEASEHKKVMSLDLTKHSEKYLTSTQANENITLEDSKNQVIIPEKSDVTEKDSNDIVNSKISKTTKEIDKIDLQSNLKDESELPTILPSESKTDDETKEAEKVVSNDSEDISALSTEKPEIKENETNTDSDLVVKPEKTPLLALDQQTETELSPESKESNSSSSKSVNNSNNDQQKQLQPINSVSIMASLKTAGKANSLSKSDGIVVSEVQTRSFTSISDAVRFSLMDMDDATDSVENQVLQAFQVSHETSQSSPPRYENNSTNDANDQASPSAVILTTPQSTSTTDLNVSQVSQRFEASAHNSQSEKFSECQSTVSRSTSWMLEEGGINETSPTINLQKSTDIDSPSESKEEEKPKKKKKRKERIDPEAAHKFWCEICHKGFFSAYNLRRHCRNVHKMDLPKGTSDLPFASNSHNHQHLQQGESSSSEIVSPTRLPYGSTQSSCVSPKGSDYMLQSPTRETKTHDFSTKVATSQHTTTIQTDFQMQTVSRISGQSTSTHISSPTKSVQPDFQMQTPTSGSSPLISPNKLSNVAKSPTTPKFQRLPTSCSTAVVSQMSQISVCGQQTALQQQRQLSQIQSSGLIQPVPSSACQAQQLQASQCPHFQSKQLAQQRIGQLQLMHHAAQLPTMPHTAQHGIQKQNPVQQYKKCGTSLQSAKINETEQMQQSAQLAQTQQILANQQMQKIMQIRQNAIAATGVATQLSLGAAVPGAQSPNVKAATQCFQSQLAVARQAAAVAQLSVTQRGQGASFALTSHDSTGHQFFTPSMQPTPEPSSCSHASFSAQNLVEYSANCPSYPTIRLSSEANDGLEDLEQFLMENMPWSSDQAASHGLAQQSGNRPSSADSLTLSIPTPASSQVKSKTPISRPKPRKPVVNQCSKNLLGNLSRGVKKKSAPKKTSKISDCSVSKSGTFSQSCANQSHGLDIMQIHCDKATSSDLKQICKSTHVNETDSSDSVQCINVGHLAPSKNASIGVNFNTFVPTSSSVVCDKNINPSYNVDLTNPRLLNVQNKNSFLEHGNLVHKNSSNLGPNKNLINPCDIDPSHSVNSFSNSEKDSTFNPVASFCQTVCSSIVNKRAETGQDIFLGQRNSEIGESSSNTEKNNSASNVHNALNLNCFTKVDSHLIKDQTQSTDTRPDLFLGGRIGDTDNSAKVSDNNTKSVTNSKAISNLSNNKNKNLKMSGKTDGKSPRIKNITMQNSDALAIIDKENSIKNFNSPLLTESPFDKNNLDSNDEMKTKTTLENLSISIAEPFVESISPDIKNSTINTEQMQELGLKEAISLNSKPVLKEKIYSSEYLDLNLSKTLNSSKQSFNGFSVSRILDTDSSPEIVNPVSAKKIDNKENVSYSSSITPLDIAKSVLKSCDKNGLLPKFDDCEKESSLDKLPLNGEKISSETLNENIDKTVKSAVLRTGNICNKLDDVDKVNFDENEANGKQSFNDKFSVSSKKSKKNVSYKKSIQENTILNNNEDDPIIDQENDLKLDINSNIEKVTEDLEVNGTHCIDGEYYEEVENKINRKGSGENEDAYCVNTKQQEDTVISPSRLRLRDTPKTSVKRVCPCCIDSRVPKKCRSPKMHKDIKSKSTLKTRTAPSIQNAKVNTRSSQRLRSRNNAVS